MWAWGCSNAWAVGEDAAWGGAKLNLAGMLGVNWFGGLLDGANGEWYGLAGVRTGAGDGKFIEPRRWTSLDVDACPLTDR